MSKFKNPTLHRTLVRVKNIHKNHITPYVELIIPAWNTNKSVFLSLDNFKFELLEKIEIGERIFLKVNLDTDNENELFPKELITEIEKEKKD